MSRYGMKKRASAVMAMILAALIILTACGGPSTLEEYVEKDKDVKKQIEEISNSETLNNELFNGSFTVAKNTINFVIKYTSTYEDSDLEIMKPALDEALDMQKDLYTKLVKELKDETKIDGIKIHIEIQNGDGKAIVSKDYD